MTYAQYQRERRIGGSISVKAREAYNAYMRGYRARLPQLRNNPQRDAEVRMERYYARRAAAIKILGGECVVCGTDERLEFDHIDPATKTANFITLFAGAKQETIDAELELAQLLCVHHHRTKPTGKVDYRG